MCCFVCLGEECIKSEGRWFDPAGYEIFGGKPLQFWIDVRYLSFYTRFIQENQNKHLIDSIINMITERLLAQQYI